MAVKIRLRRIGGKNNPNYRIIVADSRSPRNGRFIEEIGRYVPQTDPKIVEFDKEVARDWIAKGAQPTDTVARLFRDYGLYEDDLAVEESQEAEVSQEEVQTDQAEEDQRAQVEETEEESEEVHEEEESEDAQDQAEETQEEDQE